MMRFFNLRCFRSYGCNNGSVDMILFYLMRGMNYSLCPNKIFISLVNRNKYLYWPNKIVEAQYVRFCL